MQGHPSWKPETIETAAGKIGRGGDEKTAIGGSIGGQRGPLRQIRRTLQHKCPAAVCAHWKAACAVAYDRQAKSDGRRRRWRTCLLQTIEPPGGAGGICIAVGCHV